MPALTPVPSSPLSSSPMKAKRTSQAGFAPSSPSRRAALSVATMPAFRSPVPRPQMAPSTTAPPNGSCRAVPAQRSAHPFTWTVSVWPASSRTGPPPAPSSRALTLGRPSAKSLSRTSTAPSASSSPARSPAKALSFPVTLGVPTARFRRASAASRSSAWRKRETKAGSIIRRPSTERGPARSVRRAGRRRRRARCAAD